MSKEQIPARTDQETITELKKIAEKENRSFSNLIDTILKSFIADRQKSEDKQTSTQVDNDALLATVDYSKITNKAKIAFKPKDANTWYTGIINDIYAPNTKYNKHSYWTFNIDVILPVEPQWSEDNDKRTYYYNEIESIVVLDNGC